MPTGLIGHVEGQCQRVINLPVTTAIVVAAPTDLNKATAAVQLNGMISLPNFEVETLRAARDRTRHERVEKPLPDALSLSLRFYRKQK
jgi:hypothetical protein